MDEHMRGLTHVLGAKARWCGLGLWWAGLFSLLAQDPASTPAPATPETDDGYQQIEHLARVLELVRQHYVDVEKTSYKKLISNALEGLMRELDPHCQYLSPEVYEKFQREQGNTYEGVGITIAVKGNAISIVTVREDGPAARAGLLPGDVIIKINDQLTENFGLSEAAQALRGKPGETLRLTVQRPSTKEFKEVEMVRQVLSIATVKDALLLDKALAGEFKIGYVRVLQFTQPTPHEFSLALDKLEDQGVQALILDLRNNPGGLITSAVAVAGEFLPPDTVVVTVEGRDGRPQAPPFKTPDRKRRVREYPLAVLINNASASGAELVAGALQDLRRAVLVGETTFGKGSVQTIIPLENGAAVRLTTAKYFTPAHKTIHEKGISPNIVVPLTPSEEEALFAFWRRGESVTGDAREQANVGDRQLERAATVLRGLLTLAQPPPGQ